VVDEFVILQSGNLVIEKLVVLWVAQRFSAVYLIVLNAASAAEVSGGNADTF
jgi:hypothetical protein